MSIDYAKTKEMEISRAQDWINAVENSKDPTLKYKNIRLITDVRHMFSESAKLYADKIAFMQKFDPSGEYEKVTYKEMYGDVRGLGTELIALGKKGEKVGIIGETRSQWEITYLAAISSIGVVVPLDKELNEEQLEFLVKDSGMSVVAFDKKFEKFFAELKEKGETNLDVLICLDESKSTDVKNFRELIEAGKKKVESGDTNFEDSEIIADDLAVILYTSGTTGVSKGVMLSNTNIAYDLMLSPTTMRVYPDDVFFSVLPVHHSYEATAGFLMPLYLGCTIAYCEGLKHIVKNLEEVKPTILLGVPALIETLYKKIWKNIRKQGKESLINGMLKAGRATKKVGFNVSKPFLKKITDLFGGNMRLIISGGAACDPVIIQFLNDLGMLCVQGYGLTESSPIAALVPDHPKYYKSDSAGKLLFGMEVKIINEDENGIGEICLKGPNIMMGYFNNETATDEVLQDGWFATGDLGYIDENQFIFITGRQKNVIVTKNGKNVFPEEIEHYLNKSLFVDESFVWSADVEGANDLNISATIIVDTEEVSAKLGEGAADEAVEKLIWEEVDKVNETNPVYKQVTKMYIRKEPFIKTTSKKIKRFEKDNRK